MTLRNSYLESIYAGVIEKKTIKEIHKELYDNTMKWKNQGLPIDNIMYNNALKLTKKIKKKIPNEIMDISLLSSVVFEIMENTNADKFMSQNIYKNVSKVESDVKTKALLDTLIKNRKAKMPKIFYLASKHDDSASDHKDWQGKIYVDEKWKSLIVDKDLRKKVRDYINKHNIKTFQWITQKPVWFITRPNCRHYFKSLQTEDVLENSVSSLLEKNDMTREIGQRAYLQTINHPTNKKWYEDRRNAELILKKYQQRYAYHKKLYNAYSNDLLYKAMQKDLLLIKKWKRYLQTQ